MKSKISCQRSSRHSNACECVFRAVRFVKRSRFLQFLLIAGLIQVNARAESELLNVTPGMLSGPLNFYASPAGLTFNTPIPYGQANNASDNGWIWPQDNSGSLQVDFGTPTVVNYIRAWSCYPGGARGAQWHIEASTDATTWVAMTDWNYVTSVGGGVNDDGTARTDTAGWYDVSFNAGGAAYRYWRIRQVTVLVGNAARTGEMQFFNYTTPFIHQISFGSEIFNPPTTNLVIQLEDGSLTAVDTNTIHFYLNGTEVPATVTGSAPLTTITYNPPDGNLPSGINTVDLVFSDNSTPAIIQTNQFNFIMWNISNASVVSFRADDAGIVTNASGHVTLLPNEAGGGADATQVLGAPGPTLAMAVINGVTNKALRYDGTEALESPITCYTNGSLFIVMQCSDPSYGDNGGDNGQRVIGWGNSNTGQNGVELYPNSQGKVGAYVRENGVGGDVSASGPNLFYEVITLTWGPNGAYLYRNGQQVAHNGNIYGVTDESSPLLLKIGATGAGKSVWFKGDILALKIYNTQLDDSSRAMVETNLMQSLNISALEFRATRDPNIANQVNVLFSQPLDSGSATAIANYSVNNGNSVTAATLDGAGTTVTLTLANNIYFTTTNILTVNNVMDVNSDVIPANYTGLISVPLAPGDGPGVYQISFAPVLPTGEIFNPPNTNLVAELVDGNVTALDTNTIHLYLNGTEVATTMTVTGPYTTLTYDPPGGNLPAGSNTVSLVFSDNGVPAVTQTNQYSFILKNISSASVVSFRGDDADIVTNASGHVTLLPNEAGGGADATQVLGITNLGPTLGTAVIGGVTNKTLHFDGTEVLESPITCYTNGSLFIVMQCSDPSFGDNTTYYGQRVIGWGDSSTGQHGVELTPQALGGLYSFIRENGVGGDIQDAGHPNFIYEVITLTWGPNGAFMYRNGHQVGFNPNIYGVSDDNPPLLLKIGATGRGRSPWYRGDILALQIYNTQLDDSTRAAVETNLMQSFNMPELWFRATRNAAIANQVIVSFSEPLEAGSATNTINYSVNNGNSVTAASLDAAGSTVTLTLATNIDYATTNILTVNNVMDTYGNVIPANTSGLISVPPEPPPFISPIIYLQDSSSDQLLVLEAENYNRNISPSFFSGHSWNFTTTPLNLSPTDANTNYSGTGVMEADPNTGENNGTTLNGPELDYKVYFPTAGTNYIWVRGVGDSSPGPSNNDSIQVGLDGTLVGVVSGTFPLGQGYTWGTAGTGAPIVVATPGMHIINAWMREDGFGFDKLLLTTNASYTPTGIGPAQSAVYNNVTITRNGDGTVTLIWSSGGTLQASDNVEGPYVDVTGTVNQTNIMAMGTSKFFRVRY